MTPARDSRSRVSGVGDGGTFKVLVLALLAAVLPAAGLVAGLGGGLAAGPAAAQETSGNVIGADQAMQLAASGEIVVVDVRSPQEWRQTGVPAGARLVTIHQPDGLIGFIDAMGDTLGEDRDRPIALICARGNRSSLASSALAEAGYTQVYNIREGMLGSPDGPGWLARGLPTDPCGTC
ncbi:MAG: rhodanese-like domain-containing protein [Alphaproteobacteria bacterium]